MPDADGRVLVPHVTSKSRTQGVGQPILTAAGRIACPTWHKAEPSSKIDSRRRGKLGFGGSVSGEWFWLVPDSGRENVASIARERQRRPVAVSVQSPAVWAGTLPRPRR